MGLTAQQKTFFETFGYLAFPGIFKDKIELIQAEFETVWAANGSGHNGKAHDGTARSCIIQCLDRSEKLAALLEDPRIHDVAVDLLGEDFNYLGSDGNFYAGDTGWHSDGWTPGIRHVKFAFYLDPLTKDSGCLRVIPGSHRIGEPFADQLQAQIYKFRENWGLEHGRDVPCVPLETQPGDLVLFDWNTKHSSFNGSKRRRMFTINTSARYPENRLQDLRNFIGHEARFWVEQPYGEPLLRTASPERRRHLQQVLANADHMPEMARQHREKMLEPSRG